MIKKCKNDKRAHLIYLTDKGKKLNENIIPTEQEIMNIDLKRFSEERKALLKDIIDEILENMDDCNKK